MAKLIALKDTMINGQLVKKGTELDQAPEKMARLIMLGYLGEVETKVENRMETTEDKPKRVRKKAR